MARYGNTSVSALLSQARSALKKQQAYEEEIASYEYDLSNKDQEAYNKYASFLTKRANEVKSTDPAKALSLQRTLTGANRSFTSSEIQRASINILEGNSSKQDKLQTLIGLYRRALENGDEATAQRIQLQADTLQQSIFAEQNAGRGGGGGGRGGSSESAYAKGYDEALKPLKALIKEAKAGYESGKLTRSEYIKAVSTAYTGTADKPGISQLYNQAQNDENLSEAKRYTYQNEFNSIGGSNAILKDLHEAQQQQKGAITSLRYIDANGQITTKEVPTTGDELGLNLYGNNIAQKTDLSKVLKSGDKYTGGLIGRTVETDPLTGAPVYRNEAGDVVEKGTPGAALSTSSPELAAAATFEGENGVRYRNLFSPISGEAQRYEQYTNPESKTTNLLNPDRLYPTVDKNGRPINAQEDFGASNPLNFIQLNPLENLKSYFDPNTYEQGKTTLKTATDVINKATQNRLFSGIGALSKTLGLPGFGNRGQANGSINIGGLLAGPQNYLNTLKQKKVEQDQARAAEAARQEAQYRASLQAIQQANAATATRQTQANRGLPVITPTINKPTPQAQVIGSRDFNKTYLGGFGDLLNKYTR